MWRNWSLRALLPENAKFFRKMERQSLGKHKPELPCDPAVPFLSMCPKQLTSCSGHSMFKVLYHQRTNAYTRPNPLKYKREQFLPAALEWRVGGRYFLLNEHEISDLCDGQF